MIVTLKLQQTAECLTVSVYIKSNYWCSRSQSLSEVKVSYLYYIIPYLVYWLINKSNLGLV